MGSLSNLLRWKESVTLRDERGIPIIGEDGNPVVVWIRIINDKDLEDSFKEARIVSAKIRAELMNEESSDYAAIVSPFDTATLEQCYDMALAGLGANWMTEALSVVVRPEKPSIEQIAKDPDAPTLEEQEKLDKLIEELEEKYLKELEEFVEIKEREARAMLDQMTYEELKNQAKYSVRVTVPIETFINELRDQKLWRAIYLDEVCTKRGFTDINDFRSSLSIIKEQLREAYDKLESRHSQVKN